MIFYPKSYFNKIVDIDVNFFIEKNIKAVLLDIDNTILDKRHNMVQGLEEWVKTLKKNNIKICILSNTNKKKKAQNLSDKLEVPFIYFAKKPLKFGFKKAKKILEIEDNKTIAVIGDQVLTDVFGANRCKMYSILVKPLKKEDIFVTKINRLIEKQILKSYFKQINQRYFNVY